MDIGDQNCESENVKLITPKESNEAIKMTRNRKSGIRLYMICRVLIYHPLFPCSEFIGLSRVTLTRELLFLWKLFTSDAVLSISSCSVFMYLFRV